MHGPGHLCFEHGLQTAPEAHPSYFGPEKKHSARADAQAGSPVKADGTIHQEEALHQLREEEYYGSDPPSSPSRFDGCSTTSEMDDESLAQILSQYAVDKEGAGSCFGC